MDKLINEKFGFSLAPVGLHKVDKIGGHPVYSSDKLKKTFIEALENQKILKPVIKDIERLIAKKKIIPCYTEKNLLNVIMRKAFSNAIDNSTYGLYEVKRKKIYILFDANVKYFMWLDNEVLSQVVIHELMHYHAMNYVSQFYSSFKSDLEKYYREFLKLYLRVNTSKVKVSSIINFCVKEFESDSKFSRNSIFKLSKVYDKVLKEVIPDKETRKREIVNILSVIKVYILNMDAFASNVQRGDPKTIKLLVSLLYAYKALGVKNPATLPIQEIIFPSEVIAIQTSKRISSKHYAAVKSIS
jgi:hypothetical protein|tara:strand:- start:326 stop:1225 length:900 start_codon:yes stop_codon:yes gene_type:complete